jgi:hypothetical protein
LPFAHCRRPAPARAAEAESADARAAVHSCQAALRSARRLLSGDELRRVDYYVKARSAPARRVLGDNIQRWRRRRRPRWLPWDLDHHKPFDMARRLERFHDQRTVNLFRLIRRKNIEI